ncbi:Predicted arabinose efflux permease, MFS family [Duganella sp. CF402]|nr:putative MFS family arabinose efflux permease [Duganella sp. BK701]SEM02100.1 Predicted arabinose efflux permease, MFS family [Duganella sp. CF402]
MAILALAPALPTLLAHFSDVPNARLMVPLLITAPSLCIALFAPVSGVIADRFGRRRLMLYAMIFYGAGGLIPFFVDSFWAVVGGRIVIGLGEAGVLTVVNTLMADYFEEKERHRWLMVQGIVGSVLGTLTVAGSGFLAAQGWHWPFLVYGAAVPILLASALYLFEPDRQTGGHTQSPKGLPFPYKVAILVCGVTMLLSTIYYVQVINFSLVLKELGINDPRSIGLISAVPTIGVPIGAILFGMTTRFGTRNQVQVVCLLYAIGLIGIGFSANYKMALGFAFVQQIGNGALIPILIAWAQSMFSFEHRGRAMGWWASSFFIAQFLSPAVVNVVRVWVGTLQDAFTIFGFVCVALVLVVWFARMRFTVESPSPAP